MSDPPLEINVTAWVEKASADPVAYRQRQAVEITLNAIAATAPLNEKLYLKGGVLMGLAYGSPRQTADVDLTAAFKVDADIDTRIAGLMTSAFAPAAARLGYTDLALKVHSIRRQPRAIFETASAPALKMKVAFALRGTDQEKALLEGKTPGLIEVDISFNEVLNHFQVLRLSGGSSIRAYSLSELIAEKYRAILQQKERNRNRRQDTYDLDRLISENTLDDKMKSEIFATFKDKCRSRSIEPVRDALDDADTELRSGTDWASLKIEIGDVPDFEACYARVNAFYKALPW